MALQKFLGGDINDIDYKKKIIYGLVNSVWVFDGGVFIFYNIDKKDPITLDELKDSLKENDISYDAICNVSNMIGFGDP